MDVLSVIVGAIIGMVVTGSVVWLSLPSLMLSKRLSGHNYDATLTLLNEALQKKQDWHVLKTNDYQERTAAFNPIERICSMNVCNPRYASEILAQDTNRGVTAFMPLALGIYENKKGKVFVSKLNIRLLGLMFGGSIAKVMKKAGADLTEIVASVAAQ